MADENDIGRHECCIAKNMVGMFMRINHMAHGFVGDGFEGLQKAPPDADAATCVYHRNFLIANDETHIRNVAEAGCIHADDGGLMRINAGSDLTHIEGLAILRRNISERRSSHHCDRDQQGHDKKIAACADQLEHDDVP